MKNDLISTILQLLAFCLIPFLWWAVTASKKMNFFQWVGLKKTNVKKNQLWLWLFVFISVAVIASYLIMPYLIGETQTATSEFQGTGFTKLPSILLFAVIKTGLSEEILFRGFLGKRIGHKFGFAVGNSVQALIFGLLHGVAFILAVNVVSGIIMILFIGIIGWMEGYINEKKAAGSILPSWIAHSIINIVSSLSQAF